MYEMYAHLPTYIDEMFVHLPRYLIFQSGLTLASFSYFRSFQQPFYRKIIDLRGIWTLIVRVDGKHADHLTTARASQTFGIYFYLLFSSAETSNKNGLAQMADDHFYFLS